MKSGPIIFINIVKIRFYIIGQNYDYKCFEIRVWYDLRRLYNKILYY